MAAKLTLHEGPRVIDPDEATRVASTRVAEGYECALETPGLDIQERALLVRQLGRCRVAYDIGVLIRRYIAERPPPASSTFAADFEDWSTRLIAHGEDRLSELGASPLVVVAGATTTEGSK